MFTSTSNQQSLAKLSIVGLLATLIVMMPLAQSPAKASTIVPNNGVCDLATVSANVYSISNALQLWEVTDCVATDGGNNTFRLNNDIDVSGEADAPTTSPIGTSTSPVAFTGTLDGNNRSVTGISMSSSTAGVGLFALLTNAQVNNLSIEGSVSYLGSNQTPQDSSGGLAVRSTGTLTVSSVVSNAVVVGNVHVGGVVGRVEGILFAEQVSNQKSVTGTRELGGLFGRISGDAEVLDSSNYGDIGTLTGASQLGGLIGRSDASITISGSTNHGEVNSGNRTSDVYAGGLLGSLDRNSPGAVVQILSSTNSGDVSSLGWYVGGLVGYVINAETALGSSANSGDVSGKDYVGGVFGALIGAKTINNSLNSGDVTATGNEVGGLVGYHSSTATITNFSNAGTISGLIKVGGLIGYSSGLTTISNAVNSGAILGSGSDVGGLVGLAADEMRIYRSFNSASVSSSEKVGGLVGFLDSGTKLNIEESFNTGNVGANSGDAGGFVGISSGTVHLLNSFNAGSVTVDGTSPYAGGFLVQAAGASSATNSYQVGLVTKTGSGYTDALFALRGGAPRAVESVYINTQIASGFPRSTDEQLQQKATYVDWDFDDVWGFVCGTNNNFPVLRFANPTSTAEECSSQAAGAGSAGAAAPAPTYTGPTLVSQAQPVAAGGSVTFTGSKLDVVSKAMIGTTEVPISSQTATSLTITVPATLAAATYDLVLFSSFGTLSVMGAITITGVQADGAGQAQLLGWSWTLRFQGNSRSLSPAQDSHLRARVLAQPNATTVICWGYTTASSPNAWAIAHATQRAEAACNLVAAANSEVKTVVRLRYGVEKSSAMRSALQFWR